MSEKLVGNNFAAPTQFGEMETHFNIQSENIASSNAREMPLMTLSVVELYPFVGQIIFDNLEP